MKKLLIRSLILLTAANLIGCATVQLPPVINADINPDEAWSRVLQTHVNDKGQINFAAIQENPQDLLIYLNYIATAQPQTFASDNDRLAHYINAYNAAAMYGVINAGIPKTNAGTTDKFNFFYLKRYKLDGKEQSLYAYEESIRNLGDPRVHFVLNCMSVGCPVLPRTPFQAEGLHQTLDAQARAFFADPSKLVVTHSTKTVQLSEILKFYESEFLAKADSLIAYVNQFVANPIPTDYKIEYIPYDWTFNRQ